MYKIIQNDKVIDVVKIPHFVYFLSSGHIFKPVNKKDVTVVKIEEITLEELNRLQGLLSSNQEVSADGLALAEAKRNVIAYISNTCKSRITAGFEIVLSDNNKYDFKLTAEDQLNLLSIENQLNNGVETFIYHATGQPCRFFSKEDMTKIITTFKRHTLYHTTYFNIAKQYIASLVDIEKVNRFAYGMDVSEATDNVVIKQILKNGGNF